MKEEFNEEIKKLVIARIDAKMPSNIKISIGSGGSLSKEEMINHIKEGDEQGQHIIRMHMNFIRAVTSGEFIKEVNKA